MRLVDTTDWQHERIAPHGPAITSCLTRLAERHEGTATAESLFRDVWEGRVRLWLVMDGDELKSVILTAEEIVDGTGEKIVSVKGFAGEDGMAAVDGVLPELEAWAKRAGAKAVWVHGRLGWARALRASGYRPVTVVLRKEVA